MKRNLLIIFLFLCALIPTAVFAGSMQMVTYYPTPVGIFDRLRLIPADSTPTGICNAGTLYNNSTVIPQLCASNGLGGTYWKPLADIWAQTENNIYLPSAIDNNEVLLGIGTMTPEFRLTLDIDGGIMAKGSYDLIDHGGWSEISGTGEDLTSSGPGTYFIWYPKHSITYRGTINSTLDFGNGIQKTWGAATMSPYSVVMGGLNNAFQNTTVGIAIGGGFNNLAGNIHDDPTDTYPEPFSGHNNLIMGGSQNRAVVLEPNWGGGVVIMGGKNNHSAMECPTIMGGEANRTNNNAHYSYIGGGYNNRVDYRCYVTAGQNNTATSSAAGTAVTGGSGNNTTQNGMIIGGSTNVASNFSFVGGGENNSATTLRGSIGGGDSNSTQEGGVIIGGFSNTQNSGSYASMLGGSQNYINEPDAIASNTTLLGGQRNTISPIHDSPLAPASHSMALGANMLVSGSRTFAWGHVPPPDPPIDIYADGAFVIQTGRVGINVSAPAEKLHIQGDVQIDSGTLIITTRPTVGGIINHLHRHPVTKKVGTILNDAAEIYNSDEEIETGEIITLKKGHKVGRSQIANDPHAIGIASLTPPILLRNGKLELTQGQYRFTKGKEVPVALKGRVLCKVSSENGEIRPGDLLTTSSVPGHAMKATDIDETDGVIIGKAMESFSPLAKTPTTGMIVVLVTLQ